MTDNVISKTTYYYEVLHRTDDAPVDLYDALEDARASAGRVGKVLKQYTHQVPDRQVPAELEKLGVASDFFDIDLAPEDEDRV